MPRRVQYDPMCAQHPQIEVYRFGQQHRYEVIVLVQELTKVGLDIEVSQDWSCEADGDWVITLAACQLNMLDRLKHDYPAVYGKRQQAVKT